MSAVCRRNWLTAVAIVGLLCATGTGCHTLQPTCGPCDDCKVPKEFTKVNLPTYVVEPPDILLIDAVKLVPRPPYKIEPLDGLLIQVSGVLQTDPIGGIYPVDPDGSLNLGLAYGVIQNIAGKTLEEAKQAIESFLKVKYQKPEALVALGQSRGLQQIRGDHLVRPDGTVSLGSYGDVHVAGQTLPRVKATIEAHLSQFLQNPEISIDVGGYNSKVYYIIADGAGQGQQVIRLPITGNETVLDALSLIGGMNAFGSQRRIWIARPAPSELCCQQILPVDWKAITQTGSARTNYQLLPGDRLFINSNSLVGLDIFMARAIAPVERLFGITLLGVGLKQTISQAQGGLFLGAGNFGGGGFFGGF